MKAYSIQPAAGMIISDLDGTLLRCDQTVSASDLEALGAFGCQGIIRVLATGRSLYSLRKVIADDFPVDFVIFSTGAGVLDCHTREVIYARQLAPEEVHTTTRYLQSAGLDFMLHAPLPDNHYFWYYRNGRDNPDMERRLALYAEFARPLPENLATALAASQFVCILADGDSVVDMLRKTFPRLTVVRTSSPLDHRSVWIELLPDGVSKGHTARWLCERLGVPAAATIALGNDYNDLSLLEFAGRSYVVADAPFLLRERFQVLQPIEGGILTGLCGALIEKMAGGNSR